MTEQGAQIATRVLVTSTAVFVAIAIAVFTWEDAARRDVQFVNWVHSNAPESLVDSMRVLTYAGSVFILAPLTLAAALVFIRCGRRLAAVLVLLTLVGALLVDELLKAGFRRARPEFEDPFVQLTTYAFPSGHAFGAAATYGALAVALTVLAHTPRARNLALMVAVLLIVIVAASRVILGVHYISDVVAGVVAGVALVSGLVLLLAFLGRPLLRPVPRKEQAQRARIDA